MEFVVVLCKIKCHTGIEKRLRILSSLICTEKAFCMAARQLIQIFNIINFNTYKLTNLSAKTKYLCSCSHSAGLPVPAIPAGLPSRPRKTPAKKRKTLSVDREGESSSESSEDSDEDWVPGSEEVRRRKKMIKRFLPGS